jgi:hypothetical protein
MKHIVAGVLDVAYLIRGWSAGRYSGHLVAWLPI